MPAKKLFWGIVFGVFIFSSGIAGQEKANDRTTVNEDFKLNITNKQVTETDYKSELEVTVKSDTDPSVSLQIGAEVKAEKITMTLKNIFGDVRFHGSLEKILNQINLRRPPIDKQ